MSDNVLRGLKFLRLSIILIILSFAIPFFLYYLPFMPFFFERMPRIPDPIIKFLYFLGGGIVLLPLLFLLSIILMCAGWHSISIHKAEFRIHFGATAIAAALLFLSLLSMALVLYVESEQQASYAELRQDIPEEQKKQIMKQQMERAKYMTDLMTYSSVLFGASAFILGISLSHGIYKLGKIFEDSILIGIGFIILLLSSFTLLLFLALASSFSLHFLFLIGINPWLFLLLLPVILGIGPIALISLFIELGRLRSRISASLAVRGIAGEI